MNVFGLCVGLTVAMGPQPEVKVDPARMNVIWNAFENRVTNQNDQWFEDGEFPRIVQLMRVMVALQPGNYDKVTNLGWMLENIERWDEALKVYVSYKRKHGDDPDAYFPEANFYYMKKAYSRVPPIIEPTLKMKQKPHANSYRILGLSYEKLGLLSDAQRVFKQLLKRNPNDGAAKNNLARVESKLKGNRSKE